MRTEGIKRGRMGRACFSLMSFLVFFLILRNSELASVLVGRGLRLCVNSLIPSLFPFMIASEMLARSDIGRHCGRFIGRPIGRLLKISESAAFALLLGLMCGFPIGARMAMSLYREGRIDRDELLRLVCVSSVPSSAFVIGTVGGTFFGSRELGTVLYVSTLLSALLLGVLSATALSAPCKLENNVNENRSSASMSGFAAAVGASALGMLSVCAFVVFFCVISGIIEYILGSLGASPELRAFFASILEITGGASASAALRDSTVSLIVAAFSLGWSGFSVHLQIMNICDGAGLSFCRYFLSKLCQGILNVVLVLIYVKIFGVQYETGRVSMPAWEYVGESASTVSAIICIAFLLCLCVLAVRFVAAFCRKNRKV